MDKAWAVRSGLGWLGKHTNVINKEIGSWFFIANIITNWQFEYSQSDSKIFADHAQLVLMLARLMPLFMSMLLDSNRCISYLTIENKGDIPEEFKGKFENWIFGCDICQDVCPWNQKFSQATTISEFHPKDGNYEIDLEKTVNLTKKEFDSSFSESPIKRAKLSGLKRNASFLLTDQNY